MENFERFSMYDGQDANGVHTTVHFENDYAIKQMTYDVEPILIEAARRRRENEGKKWNEGKTVGMIPLPVLDYINKSTKDRTEREVKQMNWLKMNPLFITYPPHFENYTPRFLS